MRVSECEPGDKTNKEQIAIAISNAANLRAVFSATRASFCPTSVLVLSLNCCSSSDCCRALASSSETCRLSDFLSSRSNRLLSVSRFKFSIYLSENETCKCIHILYMYMYMYKAAHFDCLGCVVLLCFVVYFASFFLPISHIHVRTCTCFIFT